jgi:hypothetical protein
LIAFTSAARDAPDTAGAGPLCSTLVQPWVELLEGLVRADLLGSLGGTKRFSVHPPTCFLSEGVVSTASTSSALGA